MPPEESRCGYSLEADQVGGLYQCLGIVIISLIIPILIVFTYIQVAREAFPGLIVVPHLFEVLPPIEAI